MARIRWVPEYDKWIKENNEKFNRRADMVQAFNEHFQLNATLTAMDRRCQTLELHRSIGFKLNSDGHGYRYEPIGTEKIRVSGSQNKPIWFVKIGDEYCGGENKKKAPYQWKKKHILVWEQANGKIPKGNKIVFLNTDTLDCRLENLYLTTDAVHMMMIKYGWYSENPEITKTALKCCELELLTKKVTNAPDRH